MDLENRRQGLKLCIVCLFVLCDVTETMKESSWFGNEGAMVMVMVTVVACEGEGD